MLKWKWKVKKCYFSVNNSLSTVAVIFTSLLVFTCEWDDVGRATMWDGRGGCVLGVVSGGWRGGALVGVGADSVSKKVTNSLEND